MAGGVKGHRSPRYQIALSVTYRTTPRGSAAALEGSGRTRNLSDTGGCLELDEPLSSGMSVALTFRDDGEALALQAEVVWVGHPRRPSGGILHGVTFLSVTAEQRQALHGFIQRKGRIRSRNARIPAALPTECRLPGASDEPVHGWTGDLSWEGCSLLLPDRFPVGTMLEVALTTPRGDVSAKATVVWVEPMERLRTRHLTRHGVRFAQVSWTREHALDLVLDRIPTGVVLEAQTE
jgi:c-di-GMP-binding flagellar brake protein YcgR